MEHIEKAGTSLKIPASIIWLLLKILRDKCDIEEAFPPSDPTLNQIWEAQMKIGFHHLILGWISRSHQPFNLIHHPSTQATSSARRYGNMEVRNSL
jgi:hypothetical protein